MPADQRGQAYKISTGKWGLRYYDRDGKRRRKSSFPTRSAAYKHYREHIEPTLRGERPDTEMTLSELVEVYLERHAGEVRPRTIETLRERLRAAEAAFGDVPLDQLERMAGEIGSWQASLSERSRYGKVQALRQTLAAAIRWGYMERNPAVLAGRNRQPSPREVRAFSLNELAAIAAELSAEYRWLPGFAAATGLRPGEWQALEHRDIDVPNRVLTIRRTVSDGEVVTLAKTLGARRQVPLSRRAVTAYEAAPRRDDTQLLVPAPQGGVLDLDNWRGRQWEPAIEASGVQRPARIYDLRSTFASDALDAGIGVYALARIMGTSVRMIERHYGTLLDGAYDGFAARLDELDARRA